MVISQKEDLFHFTSFFSYLLGGRSLLDAAEKDEESLLYFFLCIQIIYTWAWDHLFRGVRKSSKYFKIN